MHEYRFSGFLLAVLVGLSVGWGLPVQPAAGGPDSGVRLPSLDQAVEMALAKHPNTAREEVAYEVKKHLYQMLAKKEQLGITDEVREHFETAITKAEEKMETGEGEISQSAITKLKLGLAGTLNDISDFKGDIALSRLHLGQWLGRDLPENSEPAEDNLEAIEFPHVSLQQFLKAATARKTIRKSDAVILKESLIKINRGREKMALARKNRKITRALLVTEVANYDFGIGSEGDLFEALIIYTRVLVGFYETIFQYNLAVLELQKQYAALPS